MATVAVAGAAILAAGCGDSDFENKARPAVRLQLTGVIQPDKVTVSPSRHLGAGPFEITISNQTDAPPQPVDAGDTLTIRRTLDPGTYKVSAGSETAAPKEIEPATLDVGAERRNSNSDLMLP